MIIFCIIHNFLGFVVGGFFKILKTKTTGIVLTFYSGGKTENFYCQRIIKYKGPLIRSDVNVHKTNSFFINIFQFVSMSRRNVSFYSYTAVMKNKMNISFHNIKEITKTNFRDKVNKNELFSVLKSKTLTFRIKSFFFAMTNL
jgi:hypothetical protein